MTPRRLFMTTGIGALVSACADLGAIESAVPIAAHVVSDIEKIAAALGPLIPVLGALNGVPPDTIAQATTAINLVAESAAQINTGMSVAAAQPHVGKLVTAVFLLLRLVRPFAGLLPPPWGEILMAVSVLAPLVGAAVGIAVPPPPGPMRIAPAFAPMSPDAARAILGGRP